ncbi:MAG: hypothetical protein MJ016_04980 [Victivallaceae bacterium]|nr:hypothetical protein [Victivallaceae bacterium]
MTGMALYNYSPVWVQNLLCSLEGYRIKIVRYGNVFRHALKEYESRNDWSYERLCDFRDLQLRKLVRHCYDTVPYYHRLFNEGGINPDGIKTLDDLKRLPILTKETVKRNPEAFLSSRYASTSLVPISTSGSTGSSLTLLVLPDNIARQYAVWWRYRRRLGIGFDMWHDEFGSRTIVPPSQRRPPYWRICRPLKQVMFSAFHGNASSFPFYFDRIRKDGFQWFHATPSVFIPFASYCLENGCSLGKQIRFITTGAENLYDHQKRMICEAFGVSPKNHYGLTEAVANFSETPDGIMEVDEDFAAVEFVPEGDSFHIVGTSLINYTMPLLRYATADIAQISGKIGRRGRIVDRIDGRSGDAVFLPDGIRIGTLSALFSTTDNIVEAQIYQAKDYSLEIRFVPKNEKYAPDLERVRHLLAERIGNTLAVRFRRMEKIPRTERGKLRYIISDVCRK